MNFAQKAASTVVSRMLLEMDALPKGSGNVDQVMALVGTSNAILKGIEELRDTNAGTELELGMAQVQERPAGEKDPLEGMSESKVDFDNPVPVPSLVAAVEALSPKKKKRKSPILRATQMRVRTINGVKVVSLISNSKLVDIAKAMPASEMKYGARMPNGLARVSAHALSETTIGPLLGFHQGFFADRREAGMPCLVAYTSGKRRYIKIRDAVAYLKTHKLKYGVNQEMFGLLMQAISNN